MADEEKGATETSSVRDDLLAAVKEHEEAQTPAREETQPQAVEESTPRTEPARDEQGRFSSSDRATSGAVARESTDLGSVKPDAKPVASGSSALSVDPQLAAAPPAWSNSVKAKWAALDPEVRAEITKREADVHKGFTKMDDERQFAKTMKEVVAPYEAIIRADGGTVPNAVQSVLNTAYILRTGDPQTKARAIQQVCQTYGIDLKLLAQPQGDVNPEVASLRTELQQLKGQMTQRQQAELQQMESQVLTTVETFAQDPKHPHFRAVSAHMGALMQAGEAKDMEQAYEMAVWARPELRQQLLADQTAKQQQAEAARVKTEKARAKGVSVRGGPGGYTPPAPNGDMTVREALLAAKAEVEGRI